jgi:hypothetical protein
MPAVPRPPPNNAQIALPVAPTDPPSLVDVTNAAKLLDKVTKNRCNHLMVHCIVSQTTNSDSSALALGSPKASDNDLARAQIYLHQICEQSVHQGDARVPTHAEIAEIVRGAVAVELEPIKVQLRKLDLVLRISCQVWVPRSSGMSSDHYGPQAYNAGCDTGLQRQYQVIDFITEGGVTESPEVVGLILIFF